MNDQERAENRLPKIYDIPLNEIDDFPDHPFKVRLDEDMDQLVESVKSRGVITPVTLRQKEDGRYEIVSGHRRRKACELAGLETVPAEIKKLTRDEAIILMVESNLQRSVILPSEKAFSYKMRLEAMTRQGQRSDLTSDPVGGKLAGQESAAIVGKDSGDSQTQVRRYIRLTELIPELLEMVDEGRIIFYDWDSPDGESGPQDGLSDHTGIVEKVENGIVYTVEGNSGDACRQRQRAVGNYEILGYGVLIP